jgi:drug/metabolite transporter (DMT)-like permease
MAAGQVFFKKTSITMAPLVDARSVLELCTNVWFVTAIMLYAAATILWVIILRDMPLSKAYPFIAVGFIIVPVMGYWFFSETLSFQYFLGVILILSGIFLTSRPA